MCRVVPQVRTLFFLFFHYFLFVLSIFYFTIYHFIALQNQFFNNNRKLKFLLSKVTDQCNKKYELIFNINKNFDYHVPFHFNLISVVIDKNGLAYSWGARGGPCLGHGDCLTLNGSFQYLILFLIKLYCVVLLCGLLCLLCCVVLCCVVLCCVVLCCVVLWCVVLCCILLTCILVICLFIYLFIYLFISLFLF